jgi:serine/threonine protein kinase/peptidoglycan hydrolase-like protein with peptidoglycan-binding domain
MSDATSQSQGEASPVDFVALSAGRTIGRYEVVSVLGQGGFGITYRARDSQLGREVAIKEYLPLALAVRQDGTTVLPRSTGAAEDFAWGRERFVAEGRTLASLHHAPAIVRVFDFLEVNGTAYIVMQLLHGETLEDRLKRAGPLGPEEVGRILWPLLDGLEQVHNAGFLHRDIKPANILLDAAGNPTLIDFGASRAAMAGRSTALTAVFTPGYAAAEQMTSAKQGPWTDIYGLSATLYHAITGHAPPSAFDRMLDDTYEPLGQKVLPGFPRGLMAGLDAGLSVRASDRPQSIAGWRPILGQTAAPDADATVALARTPPAPVVHATPAAEVTAAPVAPPPAAAAPKRRAALYGGVAAAVLLLAGGGGYFMFASKPAPQPTAAALQDLKVEDLERVLAERRKADAAAAEKRRLEEEAQRKAEADAAAKHAADAELEKAQQQRQKAEEELANLKAEIEARRKEDQNQSDAVAKRAAAEAAQRKAEAEMAALRQAEEDAKRKAAVEAEAKRQADEALAKAQADRQKADAEAKQKAEAEAKQKADADAKQIAEAEARQKAEIEAKQKAEAEAKQKADAEAERKAAESAETALRLAQTDRQRVQVALTSLGFDTRGSDGAFGPRSREMIAAWQKARNSSPTGYLTAPQMQALLKEGALAVSRFDDEQKKVEEAKKKADEEKAKAEAAARAAPPQAAPAPQQAAVAPTPAAVAPPAAAPAGPKAGPDGVWRGQMNCTKSRMVGPFTAPLQITVSGGTGTWVRPGSGPGTRGNQSISIRITGQQVVVSRVYVPAGQSATLQTATMRARYDGANTITGSGVEDNSGDRMCDISLTRSP